MRTFKTFRFICVAVLLMIGTGVSAYDFTVDGIYYNVVSFRELTCGVVDGDEKYAGDIIIPDEVKYKNRTFTVTRIVDDAFRNCSVTSVTIPNSVTRIGDYVFNGCSELKKLIIEDGTEPLNLGVNEARWGGPFGKGLFYDCPLTSLYLGRNLSYSISYRDGFSPFYGSFILKDVTIGNSVTEIGEYAFGGCSGLTSVTIGNSVTSIGKKAFMHCSGLTSVTIPNSVTSIGEDSFYGCSGLTELYSLNPTPPTIGEGSFTNAQFMDLNVYVPQGSLAAYQSADVWKDFWNLQGFDSTVMGVETIKPDGKKANDAIYDIQGRKLNAPKAGLNIINGKKVLIKE